MGVVKNQVTVATRAELTKAGHINTPDAQVALKLAELLDKSNAESVPSAVAALAKEWRALMEALRAKTKPKADPVDQLEADRKRRQAAAAKARPRAR